jgi:hypothetical protein
MRTVKQSKIKLPISSKRVENSSTYWSTAGQKLSFYVKKINPNFRYALLIITKNFFRILVHGQNFEKRKKWSSKVS